MELGVIKKLGHGLKILGTGELTRVVVDPVARAVTHLVVEPANRLGIGRLVPVELVDSTAEDIRLRCMKSEFEALEDAEETRFLTDHEESLRRTTPDVIPAIAAVLAASAPRRESAQRASGIASVWDSLGGWRRPG